MSAADDAPRLITNAKLAKANDVTTRTLYSWERRGIIPPAIKIAGRKYHPADTRPRFDNEAK